MTEPIQQDFPSLVWDMVSQTFKLIPSWLWFTTGFLLCFSVFVRLCSLLLADRPVFFAGFGSWIKRKVTDLMCKTSWGFKLMYKLGWAERGVHFFDCGQDCHFCPKSAECDFEVRNSSNT